MAPKRRRKLIDFCCKAGGASMGYHIAGFNVTGVDIEHQINYPFDFHQGDITKITDRQVANIRKNFDAVAGSPPCKVYGKLKHLARPGHPDLVAYTRDLFEEIGLPYIIENIPEAPLINPVQICGSALGLRIERHRLFESNCRLRGLECRHDWQIRDPRYTQWPNNRPLNAKRIGYVTVAGHGDGTHFRGQSQLEIWSHAMGIDWMSMREIAQAVPPLYTFHLGKQLIGYT